MKQKESKDKNVEAGYKLVYTSANIKNGEKIRFILKKNVVEVKRIPNYI